MSTHMTTRNLIKRSYYESDQEDDLSDENYFPSSEKLVTDESLDDDDSDEEYLPNYHYKKESSVPTKKSMTKKQQTVKLSIGRLSLRKH